MSGEYTDLINEIAQKEDIINPKLQINSSTNKGDGYLGAVQFGKIIGSNKTIDVVLKLSQRESGGMEPILNSVYLNETGFYTKIIPAFTKFQEDHQIPDTFDNVAKFYGASIEPGKEVLVLENLKCDNYDMWNRRKHLPKAHLISALKTFGKFHATSYAMQRLNPELYQEITAELKEDYLLKLFNYFNFLSDVPGILMAPIGVFHPEREKHYIKRLETFAKDARQQFEDAANFKESGVILQGDCWSSNAMYQYTDLLNQAVPTKMKMIDFQMTKIGSPVLDLTYFFYAAASQEHIDQLDYFLKIYHKSLADHLAQFQLDVDDFFSWHQLMAHWKIGSKFGWFMAFTLKKMMLVDDKDTPELKENVDPTDYLQLSGEKATIYHNWMKELLIHFLERDFL